MFKHFSVFFLLFSLGAYADVSPGLIELHYQIPHPDKNWIVNVHSEGELIVVFHREGVSVSKDFGETFTESIFDKALVTDFTLSQSFIHIDSVSKRIFVGTESQLFISNDLGLTFQKSKTDFHHISGIRSVIASGENIYLVKYFDLGHDDADTNVIYISRNGGQDFIETEVGNAGLGTVSDMIFHKQILYVFFANTPFAFSDKDEAFLPVPRDRGQPWQEVLSARVVKRQTFETHFGKLFFPTSRALGAETYRIYYEQDNFNAIKPTPGIAYMFNSHGALITLASDAMPRMGGINQSKGVLFFASYKGIFLQSL